MSKSNSLRIAVTIFFIPFLFSGCATIFGGSNYYAHVYVQNRPNTQIIYNGENMGRGTAIFSVPRKNADKFAVVLKEDSGQDESFNFRKRAFRGLAFAGTVICWTGITSSGIPLPWGVLVDMSTGALWKPDITEPGVSKIDNKNFQYTLTYTGFNPEAPQTSSAASIPVQQQQPQTKAQQLIDLKELLDKGILTQEEFDHQKQKILAE